MMNAAFVKTAGAKANRAGCSVIPNAHPHTIHIGQHIVFLSRVLGLGLLALMVATMGGAVTTAVATCMELEKLHFSFRHYKKDIYPTKHIES